MMLACPHHTDHISLLLKMKLMQDFGELIPGVAVGMNTFESHVWTAKLGDKVVAMWEVTNESTKQDFVLRAEDIKSSSIEEEL
jgi:hypothetical protein